MQPMFKMFATSFGLIALSAIAGVALFSSHEALASGNRLSDVLAQDSGKARLASAAPGLTYTTPETAQVLRQPTLSTQGLPASPLAPRQALRPVARPGGWAVLQDGATAAPVDIVSSNAQPVYRVYTPAPQPRTPKPVATSKRYHAGQDAAPRRPGGYFRPEYMIGVFQ